MTIHEFVNQGLFKNVDLKTTLEIRTYIPIAEKKAIAETVLDKCFTVEDGVLICDYVTKRVVFELAMIKYHTNLDIDIMSTDDYDMIKSRCDLHKEYEDDYVECKLIFDDMEKELCSKYSIETSIIHLSNRLSDNIESIVKLIANKIDELDMSKFGFEDINLEQFQELINKYGK